MHPYTLMVNLKVDHALAQTNVAEYLSADRSSDTSVKDKLCHVQNQDEYNAYSTDRHNHRD